MRVRTAEQVARRAVIVRRFIRAVPRGQCIKVDLFWLGVYGFVMAFVGAAVSALWMQSVLDVFYRCVRVH